MSLTPSLDGVSVIVKANIYFGGKVISYTILCPDGKEKTVGVMFPGSYRFDTKRPERIQIVSGSCTVEIAYEGKWKSHDSSDEGFQVPSKSHFQILVPEDRGILQYVCHYGE